MSLKKYLLIGSSIAFFFGASIALAETVDLKVIGHGCISVQGMKKKPGNGGSSSSSTNNYTLCANGKLSSHHFTVPSGGFLALATLGWDGNNYCRDLTGDHHPVITLKGNGDHFHTRGLAFETTTHNFCDGGYA